MDADMRRTVIEGLQDRIQELERQLADMVRWEEGHAQQSLEIIELNSKLEHYQQIIDSYAECASAKYQVEQQLADEIGMRDVVAHEVVELRQEVERLREALLNVQGVTSEGDTYWVAEQALKGGDTA